MHHIWHAEIGYLLFLRVAPCFFLDRRNVSGRLVDFRSKMADAACDVTKLGTRLSAGFPLGKYPYIDLPPCLQCTLYDECGAIIFQCRMIRKIVTVFDKRIPCYMEYTFYIRTQLGSLLETILWIKWKYSILSPYLGSVSYHFIPNSVKHHPGNNRNNITWCGLQCINYHCLYHRF